MRRDTGFGSAILGAALLLLPIESQAASLRGGFWSTEPPFESTLVLNNPLSVEEEIRLILYSQSGRRLSDYTFRVGPTESKRVEISSLVSYPGSGSLELHFPEEILLPAQIQISTGESIWFHELIDERRLGDGVERFVGLIPGLVANDKSGVRLVLTNVGRRATRGEIVLRTTWGQRRTPFSVGPSQVRQVDLLASELVGTDLTEVNVVLQGPGSSLLVSGYLGPAEHLLPIRFEPRVRTLAKETSPEPMTTFFSGREPVLLVSNPHPRPISATLTARTSSGPPVERGVIIPAQGLEVLPVHDTLGLVDGVPGVISLTSDPDLRPVVQLLETDPRPLLSLMKPPAGSSSLAYSFPLQLGGAEESVLDLYNPGPEALELLVVLHFDDAIFQYPLPAPLDGGQFLSVNLSEAQRVGLKGANGAEIPKDATTGQAMVMLHPDEGAGRFLARVRLTRLQTSGTQGDFALLESCVICPAGVIAMEVFPDPITGTVGTQSLIGVLLTLDTGFQGGSSADRGFTADPFVADVIGTPALLSFEGPGTTALEAEKDACLLYVVEAIGPFESGCACGFRATFFDSATVQSFSAPTITSINPPRGLIGQEHTVTINGSAFGPAPQVNVSGAGVTAQVVSSSDTQIQVKLRVRSDATGGNHGITVTNPAGTSNSINFFVQTPAKMDFVSIAGPVSPETLDCPPLTQGFGVQVLYQVRDQQGSAIQSVRMIPLEQVRQRPNPFSPWLPIGGSNPANQPTRADGTFVDIPVGSCFPIPTPTPNPFVEVDQRLAVRVLSDVGPSEEVDYVSATQVVRKDYLLGLDYQLIQGGTVLVHQQLGSTVQ